LQDIIDRLAQGSIEPPISGESGARSLTIVHALYRSMETQGWVSLDKDPSSSRLGIGA
jgi:hypothetical protein